MDDPGEASASNRDGPAAHATDRRDRSRLFLLGFLTLYLELALIRFLSGTVWNLGYFPNLVLVSAFVGMGFGFVGHPLLDERRSARAFVVGAIFVPLLLAFVALVRPRVPGFGSNESLFGGELFFTTAPAARSAEALPFLVCIVGVIAVFACISQRTAKLFRLFPPLTAYTLDVAGSLAGIVAFMAIGWLELPAWGWLLGASLLFVGATEPRSALRRFLAGAALVAAAAIAWGLDGRGLLRAMPGDFHRVRWSPYQKVEQVGEARGSQYVYVNRIGHQRTMSREMLRGSFYEAPYTDRTAREDLPPYRRVLVIGAGSGNDTAAALLHGAEEVDAVEIDPVIARIGREDHPLSPYRDPRVRLTVDDGRAFLTRERGPFDLIVFALTDSLVKVSPRAQLRLENYVFTEEALRRAFELLDERGDLVLYNAYRRPWLVDRLQLLLRRATGRTPRTILETPEITVISLAKSGRAVEVGASDARAPTPTDDWPFLYLQERRIPASYAWVLGGFVAALIAGLVLVDRLRRLDATAGGDAAARGEVASPWTKLAFFSMGAAFLLLETKSVVQFSLLFGTTWLNNSLVFLGILSLVLLANRLAPRIPERAGFAATFVLLIVSCLSTLAIPLAALLAVESVPVRFVLASLLTFSPIFFANVLFSLAFRRQPSAEHLFGWNLLGATLGGAAEYASMSLGYRALAWVVAGCYAVAFVCLLRGRKLGDATSIHADRARALASEVR